MDMQTNLPQSHYDNTRPLSNQKSDVKVLTFEELKNELRTMTYKTTIVYNEWTIQMGGQCDTHHENGLEVVSNKTWVTNRGGRAHKVCGRDEQAATEIAAIIRLKM